MEIFLDFAWTNKNIPQKSLCTNVSNILWIKTMKSPRYQRFSLWNGMGIRFNLYLARGFISFWRFEWVRISYKRSLHNNCVATKVIPLNWTRYLRQETLASIYACNASFLALKCINSGRWEKWLIKPIYCSFWYACS